MTLYSTVWADGIGDDVLILRRDRMRRRDIARILLGAKSGDAILLNGALGFNDRWIDLFYGILVRLRGRRVALVISDATWHARSVRREARIPWLHSLAEMWGKGLLLAVAGRNCEVCFLSRGEAAEFASVSGLERSQVHFTEFSSTIWPEELSVFRALANPGKVDPSGKRSPYFFSGGNSSRDYALIAEAVKDTGLRFHIATRQVLPWPAEIVAGPVSHPEFLTLMAQSEAVVLMMDSKTRRSVGQQTFLNAMTLGKPVIVNDVAGVRDYIEDGVNGIIVPPRCPDALRAALEWVVDKDNAEAVRAMTDRAEQYVRARSPDAYFSSLDKLLRTASRRMSSLAAPAGDAVEYGGRSTLAVGRPGGGQILENGFPIPEPPPSAGAVSRQKSVKPDTTITGIGAMIAWPTIDAEFFAMISNSVATLVS